MSGGDGAARQKNHTAARMRPRLRERAAPRRAREWPAAATSGEGAGTDEVDDGRSSYRQRTQERVGNTEPTCSLVSRRAHEVLDKMFT